jgi:hypothetical protein
LEELRKGSYSVDSPSEIRTEYIQIHVRYCNAVLMPTCSVHFHRCMVDRQTNHFVS